MTVKRVSALVFAVLWLAACSTTPKPRSDYDPSADFSQYRTYSFVSMTGTDQAQYQTLISQHFKKALRREMESRGYVYDENAPDLLVNFNARLDDKIKVSSYPSSGMYYGYRGYGAWGGYGSYTDVRQYTQGTVNIDLVDAKRQQLVWEGVVVGTVREDVMENLGPRIDAVVTLIMAEYPFRAAGN